MSPEDLQDLKDAIREEVRAEETARVTEELAYLIERQEIQKKILEEKFEQWNHCLSMLQKVMSETGELKVINQGFNNANLPEDDQHFVVLAAQYITKGYHFEILMNEINSNQLLKSQWDKLMMSLKLTEQ